MQFDILTLFPGLFDSFLRESLMKKAQEKGLLCILPHNIRDWAKDKHHTVDDRPYGGGAGMVLKIDPLIHALRSVPKTKRARIILLSPAGKQFTQKKAQSLVKRYDQVVFICGRYEGVDARIKKFIDEELSIGPYVLNGGEVAAMAVIEAVARLIPGVLGNEASLIEESHTQEGVGEAAQYTRPEEFEGLKVPKILLSGDHKKIIEWRARKRRRLSVPKKTQ